MQTRSYVVTDTETNKETLVTDATSQSHALRVIVGTRFTCRAAKVDDALKFISGGDIRSARKTSVNAD